MKVYPIQTDCTDDGDEDDGDDDDARANARSNNQAAIWVERAEMSQLGGTN